MRKYRIISKRKHFYTCPICALVYVSAKALHSHYSAVHPSLTCEAVELSTDTLDDDAFEELNMNSSYLFKDDLYSLPKPVLLTNTESSTQLVTSTIQFSNSNDNNNNSKIIFAATPPSNIIINAQNKIEEVKAEEIDYSQGTLSSTKFITLTAPLQPTLNHHIPTQVTFTPVYNIQNIQVSRPTNVFQQNGQIAKKSTISADNKQLPIVATTMMISQQQQQPPSEKPEKKYICDLCSKSFSTIYNKRRHDDMFHNSNAQVASEFKCSSCDKVFTSIYNKNRHENVHKPIIERLKYKCVINNCNRGFTTQFILKMHIKKVHNVEVNW